jgi:WD40 repeat protein
MLPRRIVFEHSTTDVRFAFLPDGRLLTATHDELAVSDPYDNSRLVSVMRSSSLISSIALSVDGKQLIVGRNKSDGSGAEIGEVTTWDTTTWRPIGMALPVQRDPNVHFVCNGRLLFVTHLARSASVEWFDYPSLLPRKSPIGEFAPISLSHLDGFLVRESPTALTLFDLQGVRWRRSFGEISDGSAIAYSPDGKRLAIAQVDGTITLCSILDGRIESSVGAIHSRLRRLAFSPNGRVLAGWDESRKLKLWETMTGRELFEFPGILFPDITYLAFSPDGRVLAVSGATATNREILLYDTRTPPRIEGITSWTAPL